MSETPSGRSSVARGTGPATSSAVTPTVDRTPAVSRVATGLIRSLALMGRLGLVYGIGCGLGLGLLVGSFRIGLFGNIDILFYRGLLATAATELITFGVMATVLERVRWPDLGLRDAFAAAVISGALNLSFLVVVPVTADRSISIFLLGAMASRPALVLTPDTASTLFKQVYVDDYQQIDRRLREQWVSGNLEQVDGGYRISARGREVVKIAKLSAWLFDSRAGLLDPRVPAGTAEDHHEAPGARGDSR